MKIYIDGGKLMESFYDTPESDRSWSRAWRLINHAKLADVRENVRGEWLEKHHAYADEERPIDEWQSCKCSVCGRYDTRPYMYYFDEPRYCSWCGADMRGGKE